MEEKMAAKATTKVEMPGLKANRGKLGFEPWKAGQYLIEVVMASDDKPTRNGDYMLKLKMTILDGPEQDDDRDPLGKPLFANLPVPSPEARWYDLALTKYKNAIDAFHIRVTQDGPVAPQKFVGKRAALNVTIGVDKQTGEERQDNAGFIAVEDSDYAEEAE